MPDFRFRVLCHQRCMLFLFFMVSSSLLIAFATSNRIDVSTLRKVQIIFRHGDRNPLAINGTTYPMDPNDPSVYIGGLGELTDIGRNQLFKLGQFIRERYGTFINETYNPNEIKIWCSNTSRTFESAKQLGKGLYSGSNDQWNSPGTEVAIEQLSDKKDRWLATRRYSCDKLMKLFVELLKRGETISTLNKKYQNFFKKLSNETGFNIFYISDDLYNLHDTLKIQKLKNLQVPNWADPDLLINHPEKNPLEAITRVAYTIMTFTDELKRLYNGELVKEIFNNMENEITTEPKLILYSGHDLTLTNLLNTFGVFNAEDENFLPHYASCVIIEHHKIGEMDIVKIFFRNTEGEPLEIFNPKCKSPCKLSELKKIMEKYISVNWEKECTSSAKENASSNDSSTPFSKYPFFISKVLSLLVTLLAWN